ncbi:MAG: hypothetical protein ACKOWR_04180 [Micrococcales bacterium]
MISVRRLFLGGLTLLFGAFNVSLALFRLDRYNDSWITVAMGFGYFATLAICTVAFRKFQLPAWVAWFVALVAVLIPKVSHLTLRGENLETYDTWYVTAVGLLLGALAVRGRSLYAIVAGVIFSAEVIYFGGLEYLPKSGLSGAVILIVACIAISRGLDTSAKEIASAQTSAAQELSALETEKSMAVAHDYAINIAMKSTLPTLKKIATGKYFSKEQRASYADTEVSLRDDISGGLLVNRKVKRAVAAARSRGVDVALLDEGGLDSLAAHELEDLLDLVVAALGDVNTGRVTVRTQPKENWLVRFTASRPRVVTPDLDLKLGER